MSILYDLCPECGATLDEPEDGEQECYECEWRASDDDIT